MIKKLTIPLLLFLLAIYFFFSRIHAFLSPVQPAENASVLVVDAWLSDGELFEAAQVFKKGKYDYVLVPGGALERSLFFPGINHAGELSAVTLMYKGIPPEKIRALHVKHVKKDRTYQAALTVKQWMLSNNSGTSVNVFTSSTHARRSWLLYKKALGSNMNVGIVASLTLDYDAKKWWRSSKGFRTVTSEFIAYLYAFLFFHPDL